ncbi:MAG: NACHT domain-containing protein [Roseiflexaceae bacterium]
MDDLDTRIAHIESMRAVIGDAAADAAIAALRAEAAPPTTRQSMDASEGGSVAGAGQASAGGDLRDNALGSGNLVLHDIQIAPGGALIVGAAPADLPPRPEELRRALASYLATLLERYRFLSLQGFGTDGAQQMRVELNAVFINVWTNITIGEAAGLFAEDTSTARRTSLRRPAGQLPPLSDDLRQWLDELLLEEERILLLGAEPKGRARRRTAETADREHEQQLDRIRQRLLSPRTALELIRHHRALVLLGDPGSGKTTVLRHLAMSFALERLRADAQTETTLDAKLAWSGWLPLPILIQLRRFAAELDAAPADAGPLLAHVERALAGDRHAALARHLLARLEEGTVLLMCDGLDEVADEARRTWVAQAVALFQSRFPHSRLVLTSRTYAYRAPCQLPQPFQVATLQPLDPAAQDDFIARWYRAALLLGSGLIAEEQAPAAEQQVRDLVAALERRQRLREIAANPLLLMMIALVHQRRLRLPQQRARLYEECLLLLLEQWEQQRAEGSPAGLATILGVHEQTDRLALIQPIAYQLQMLGREEARQDEVRDWLMRRFLSLARNDGALAETLIEKFLTFLEGRSGLLIARDIKDRYAFPHKTFQEYLAARELIYRGSQPLHEQVLAQRHAPTWREVILLVAGHLVASGQPQEAKALGWKLLKADPPGTPEFYRSAVLAGEIVEELGEVLEDDGAYLKQDVVGRLVALVQGGHLIARERVEAAFLLGRLGDPRLLAPEQPAYWCDIAPGPFWYGDDRREELRQVELPHGYKIARYTVTNAEYRRFVEAGGYAERRWWTKEGWKYLLPGRRRFSEPHLWHDSRYNQPIQPVVGVTWYEAAAYCAWLTAHGHTAGWLPGDAEIRLPTWLEWERAARHTDQRGYPWGDAAPDVERTNYQETGIGRPAPVGCFPGGVAACGAQDLAGNVSEWTATPYEQPNDPVLRKDFTPESLVCLSYSAFGDKVEHLCCGARSRYSAYYWFVDLGFRVVWSLVFIV